MQMRKLQMFWQPSVKHEGTVCQELYHHHRRRAKKWKKRKQDLVSAQLGQTSPGTWILLNFFDKRINTFYLLLIESKLGFLLLLPQNASMDSSNFLIPRLQWFSSQWHWLEKRCCFSLGFKVSINLWFTAITIINMWNKVEEKREIG